MQPTTNLYLIRHGEAWAVKTNIVSGPKGDAGLTPLGRAQAERLRHRLATTREIAADALLASTLPRARQTAEIIAPALGQPIQWDDELQEIRVGPEADGLPEAEFLERYGQPDFDRDPFRPLAPGGENWGQFMLRVGTALDRIIRAYAGKTVVIVCHGGVIDGTFPFFFGLNTFALLPVGFYTHNTAITHWRLGERNGQPRWRLMRYNDDLHLYDGVVWRELQEVAEGDASRAVPVPSEE
jgi:probable phosphoglycerate mutase